HLAADAVRKRDRAAHRLGRVLDIDPELHGDLDRLVEFRSFEALEDLDRFLERQDRSRDLLAVAAILLADFHSDALQAATRSSFEPLPRAHRGVRDRLGIESVEIAPMRRALPPRATGLSRPL